VLIGHTVIRPRFRDFVVYRSSGIPLIFQGSFKLTMDVIKILIYLSIEPRK